MQSQQVRDITSYHEIDLELPGKRKCAYFCVVSDQDSTFDFLSSHWIKITVPAILPKRNQRDNQAFLVTPLRQSLRQFLRENPMERFGKCAICIVHKYDEALGTLRVRDYDNIETKRYLDVIEAHLLTNDSGLLCTVLQWTELADRDATEFYLMLPKTLPKWVEKQLKNSTSSTI